MLTARQFAEKWPGQVLKLSAHGKKSYGVDVDEPIGIVVGFRPGTKGIIGSSKVAVWHDKYPILYGLDPKINKTYNQVILDAPNYKNGIYFIPVSYLELATPPKPITIYPAVCEHCGSPARMGKWFAVCSNDHCKTNKRTLKILGPFPKINVVDAAGFILCPVCQTNNVRHTELSEYVVCYNKHRFKHRWKEGHKLNYQGTNILVWKDGTLKRIK